MFSSLSLLPFVDNDRLSMDCQVLDTGDRRLVGSLSYGALAQSLTTFSCVSAILGAFIVTWFFCLGCMLCPLSVVYTVEPSNKDLPKCKKNLVLVWSL